MILVSRPSPRLIEPLVWLGLCAAFVAYVELNPPNNFGLFGQPTASLILPLTVGGAVNAAAWWFNATRLVPARLASGAVAGWALAALGLYAAGTTAHVLTQLAIVATVERDVPLDWARLFGANLFTTAVVIVLSTAYGLARHGLLTAGRARALESEAEDLRRRLRAAERAGAPVATFGTGRQAVRLPLSEVRYLRAAGNYYEVVSERRTHLVHGGLATALAALPQGWMIRTHRSYAVAVSAIRAVSGGQVDLGDVRLPVGAKYAQALRETWSETVEPAAG